jgi:hypothetical protein
LSIPSIITRFVIFTDVYDFVLATYIKTLLIITRKQFQRGFRQYSPRTSVIGTQVLAAVKNIAHHQN